MEFLYKSSLLLALFYLFYVLFLQHETFFKTIRLYLVVGIVLSLILPSLVIPIYTTQEAPIDTVVPFDISNLQEGLVLQDAVTNQYFLDWDWNTILLLVYAIGFAVFFIKLLIEFNTLYRLIRQAEKESINSIVYATIQEQISPFSIWNYIVFNRNQFTANELAQVLAHEKVHVYQKHSFDLFLANIMTLVFWFNPFSWLYKKKLQENLEFIADKYTVNQYDKKEYQYLLLKESIKKHPFALSTNFYQSLIKKRIIMLQKSKSKKVNQLKYLLLIPVLSIFLYSFNTETIYTGNGSEKNPAVSLIETINEKQTNEEITITITKKTTNIELNSYVRQFENEGIKFSYSGVKRNVNKEIKAIKLSLKNSDGSQSQSFSKSVSEGVIDDIILGLKENQIFIKSASRKHINTNKRHQHLSAPLIVIDGKISKKSDLENIDKDKIEKINVLKGDKAIAKYGEKGKNGVIEIYTKASTKFDTNDTEKSVNNSVTDSESARKPLPPAIYFIDGKEMDKASIDMDALDVKSMHVYKGKAAIEKFGKGLETGVIEIITVKSAVLSPPVPPTPAKNAVTGWVAYKNSTYYFTKNGSKNYFYNRYGEEVKDKDLLKALTKQTKKISVNKVATVSYKNQEYFYHITNGELTFYDKYGKVVSDKKLRRKLLKLL